MTLLRMPTPLDGLDVALLVTINSPTYGAMEGMVMDASSHPSLCLLFGAFSGPRGLLPDVSSVILW